MSQYKLIRLHSLVVDSVSSILALFICYGLPFLIHFAFELLSPVKAQLYYLYLSPITKTSHLHVCVLVLVKPTKNTLIVIEVTLYSKCS